jgi:transketolase
MTDSVAVDVDQLGVDTLRFLAVDMVEAAQSGHPGAPLGQAPLAYLLWTRYLRHDPQVPEWPDRDRFVLSCGHASALLYGLLHLSGHDLPMAELRAFRQWGSRTPGHPENFLSGRGWATRWAWRLRGGCWQPPSTGRAFRSSPTASGWWRATAT